MRSLSHVPRALAAGAAGVVGCLLWLRLHIHTGLDHRLATATHHHVHLSQPELLLALWFVLAGSAALFAPALRTASRTLPLPAPAWAAARPLTLEDRLAAASFGAYAANRAARTLREGGVAFRAVGPFIVALGGPTGEPAAALRAQDSLRRWAAGRPVVWYATGTGGRGAVRFGQEAIVRPARHDLSSPRLANLRHSVARARRAGVTVVRGPWASLDRGVQRQLQDLERQARRRPRLRLTLSSVGDARDGRAWCVAVAGARVEAAVTWLPAVGEPGLVLDLLLRRPDAVPGCVELLLEEGIQRARQIGLDWVSLGACGLEDQPAWLRALNPPGLRRFKDKFAPEWHDRHIVAPGVPRALALLAVAWAHLAP